MTNLYANPYDISQSGFYFETPEQFHEKMDAAPYEEVEIDYIDGQNPRLFAEAGINQSNIDSWFDELEHIDDHEDKAIAIRYLLETGYDLEEAIAKHEDVMIWRGTARDYAAELIEQTTDINGLGWLANYIDYEAIARDMQLNSEISEIEYDVWVTNCQNF